MKAFIKLVCIIGIPSSFLFGCDKTGGTPPGSEWSNNQVVGLTMLCIFFGLWFVLFLFKHIGSISGGDCFGACGFCAGCGGDCGGFSCGGDSSCGSSCGGCGD